MDKKEIVDKNHFWKILGSLILSIIFILNTSQAGEKQYTCREYWYCDECGVRNHDSVDACTKCGLDRYWISDGGQYDQDGHDEWERRRR